jgi:predicted enzyme related to lactoylglutathione lyase
MPHVDSHTSGTLAMVADPGGAAIGVWQADQHIGAGVAEEPGAMTWWEVNTRAFEDCRRFYGQVFGWDAETLDAVLDTDDTAKRASDLGGSVGAPPFDTAYGRIAVLADPAGGHFSVITPVPQAAG